MFLGLAWETDDEGRAHRNARHARAKVIDDLEIPLAIRRPQHCAQHVGVCVLQRHVHVLANLWQRRHRIDQLAIDGGRIKIEQADPFDSVDLVQPFEQVRKATATRPTISAVHRRVLCDQNQFFGSGIGKRAGLT